MSINKAFISGNVTKDAELRATPGGTYVLTFSIAVNESVKDSNGQWSTRANYFDCVLFGKRAEKLMPMLTKGTKTCVSGRLRWSQWERDGEKRSKVEILVDEVELMGKRQNQDEQPIASSPAAYTDIPF